MFQRKVHLVAEAKLRCSAALVHIDSYEVVLHDNPPAMSLATLASVTKLDVSCHSLDKKNAAYGYQDKTALSLRPANLSNSETGGFIDEDEVEGYVLYLLSLLAQATEGPEGLDKKNKGQIDFLFFD